MQAARAAADLERELGLTVELESGHYGELTVLADGEEVVNAGPLGLLGILPRLRTIRRAVRRKAEAVPPIRMRQRTGSADARVRVLDTSRLVLRRLSVGDAEFILALLTDPAFLRYIGDKGVRTVADARNYIETGPVASYDQFGFGLYLVVSKEGGTAVGMCGLLKRESLPAADIGFAFLPPHRSKGYATEAARAVLAYGHDQLGLDRILAITDPENAGSIRILQKIGLRFERMVRLSDDAKELRLYSSDRVEAEVNEGP